MTTDTDMDGAWPLPGTARHGAVWIGGALVLCEGRDREPCHHNPAERCSTCPGRVGACTVNPAPNAEQSALAAQPAAEARPVAPAGWQWVPIDPTDAMVDSTHHGQPVDDIYRDMLSASPAAPAAVALTEEEITACAASTVGAHCVELLTLSDMHAFARAVIAEFCRKNGISAPGAEG